MNSLKEKTKYSLLITIMKYSVCIIMTVFLLAILRTLFNHTIHINFNKEWIQWIFEIIIVLFVACICYIFLFPRGIQRTSNLFSSSIQEWKNIIFVSINLGVIVNYFLVNGSVTYNTRDLLSDLFDGIMIVAILNVVVFFVRFLFKESNEDVSKKEDITDPDQPIEKIEHDLFNRSDFARTLSNVLNNISNKSLTIGIFGNWGSGKSSFYNMIKEHSQIQKQEINFIEFKPWYFSTSDDLIKRFLMMLLEEIERDGGYDPNLKKELKKYADILSSVSIRSFNSIISLKEIFNKIMPDPENSDISNVKSKIEKLLELSNRKLVVYIDDVDRLDGEEIKSIFKLVRLVADFPNIIYVIALDEEVVISALSTIYSKSNNSQDEARKYIEKFIQVPIYLPKVDEHYISKFYEKKLNEVFKEISGTPENIYLEYDPQFISDAVSVNLSIRNIIRFTNLVSVYYPILKDEVNSIDLLRLLIIKIDSPALFNYIHNNQRIFTGEESPEPSEIDKLLTFSKYRVILSFLFPSVRNHFKLANYNKLDYNSKKRIHDNEYFQQYFMYSVPEKILSHKSLLLFFDLLKLNNDVEIQNKLKVLYLKYKRATVIEKIKNYHYDLTNEQKIILIKNLGSRVLIEDITIKDKVYESILILVKLLVEEIVEEEHEIDFRFYDLDPLYALHIYDDSAKNCFYNLKIGIVEFYKSLTLDVLEKEKTLENILFILNNWKKFEKETEQIKLQVAEWGEDYKTLDRFFILTLNAEEYKNIYYLSKRFIEIKQFLKEKTIEKLFKLDESFKHLEEADAWNEKNGFSILGYIVYTLNNLTSIIELDNDTNEISFSQKVYGEEMKKLILKYGTEVDKERLSKRFNG
ncbi:KAP family P-loop NTPase fold protein [Paenibacillus kyungheensis]